MHTDDSDVTLNICLGREGFQASGLTFCGKMGKPDHRHFSHQYQHEIGRAVVHLGAQRHGADDITTGERNNLIIWNHNLGYRQVGATVSSCSTSFALPASHPSNASNPSNSFPPNNAVRSPSKAHAHI